MPYVTWTSSAHSREMAWQPQMSSTKALGRCIYNAGEAVFGDNLRIRHHDLTRTVVPETDH